MATTGTATKTKTKAAAGAAAPKIDGRMRFAWLEEYQATVTYQGEMCMVNVGTRKTAFTGPTLTKAVNLGIAAMPIRAGGGGRSRDSGSGSRSSGK